MTTSKPLALVTGSAAVVSICLSALAAPQPPQQSLRQALTFHAPFDGKLDAAHALGDPLLYSAPSLKNRGDATPGLPAGGGSQPAPGAGRYGDALEFTSRSEAVVFFRAARNMPYREANWGGTVSFWLSTDPEGALAPGFCDPVQITPRAWNDAAFFVEFEKRPGRIPFRLGVYADLLVWNPEKRRIADIPTAERPLVSVEQPPFARGKWTHVVFTFDRFNTGRPDGLARLYLDGIASGALSGRQQTFTWNPDDTVIALGLNYIGLLDDLAIFNRALSDAEVRALFELPAGIGGASR